MLLDTRVPNEEHELDPAVRARIDAVCEEGREYWHRFDAEVRQRRWHPFVAADYDSVRGALMSLRAPNRRFLEWGSAAGVVTIMADMMGFDAVGFELDPALVSVARELATRAGSGARFVVGSFIPMGWQWRPGHGDARTGTIGEGPSGYLELGSALSDFHVVYGYPWTGEEPLMLDLFRAHGRPDGHMILHTTDQGSRIYDRARM